MLVLDASVAMSWGLPDESSDFGGAVLAEVKKSGALVPSLWINEIINATMIAERRKRFTTGQADLFLQALSVLYSAGKISIAEIQPAGAFAAVPPLARRYGLTGYDATYLHIAESESLPLATIDKALRSAAKPAGVKLWLPEIV